MTDEGDAREVPRGGRSIPGQLRAIVVATVDEFWAHRWRWGALWVAVLALSIVVYPYDLALLGPIQDAGADWYRAAEILSTIGRFENSSLLFAVILAIVGLATGSGRWKQAAVGCLIAGILAGLAVTVVRPSLGRARPHADAEPGFYFLRIDSDFHSMPSGHASTNVASAVAIARLLPPLAVPAILYAGGVCWSRMQLNRHHPSDILWGITLGATIGWAVAGALRGRRRRDPSTSIEPS